MAVRPVWEAVRVWVTRRLPIRLRPGCSGEESGWSVVAFLAVFVIFFYWEILFTNRRMFPWDAADFFYPYLSFVHEELRHFRLPLWDPYVMSGYPIIGDMEAQIFYPITWLMVLLHPFSPLPYRVVEIQIIFHFFLAGLVMYWLAREFVQSKAAALTAALLFMCGGAAVAHAQHLASGNSMAWYAAVFLLARRALLENRVWYAVSAGMIFGVQTLAGHWQHAVYLGLFLGLFFAYEACCGPLRKRLWPRWILLLAVIGAVGAGLAMVQVIPSWELGNLSVRSYLTHWDVTQGNEPQFLWTLFLPNYFGGLNGVPKWYPYDLSFNYVFLTVPGFLLALAGLAGRIRRGDFFWLVTLLLFIELSLGRNGHLAPVLAHTPLLNLFRNAHTFFDLANFELCLLAAVGMETLFTGNVSRFLRQWVMRSLAGLLAGGVGLGLALGLGEKMDGWYHLLAVLAVFAVIAGAMWRGWLSVARAQWAAALLIVLQLIHYNMNQQFNSAIEDPGNYLAHDVAVHHRGVLGFLRSDPGKDFRVAAVAESPWSGNGWNVWRIPGVFGWNPITLRRYDHYIRGFTHTGSFTLPYGGPDHNLNSGMLDLLGAKYVMVVDAALKEGPLQESHKFEPVFDENNWWQVYRNREYVSKAWFYPQAYVVADENQAMAILGSNWFEARRTLLFEKGDIAGNDLPKTTELSSFTLGPDDVSGASNGLALTDPDCASGERMFGKWGAEGNWIRYEIAGPAEPGRYLLLMRYTAAMPEYATLQAEVGSGERQQVGDPVVLPHTYEWPCHKTRPAELGIFELGPGQNQITVRSLRSTPVNLYSLWLVRLPSFPPPAAAPFSFGDFEYSANRIALRASLSEDGFVLLNEIHYPGWEATINGRPAEILRADGIFRALWVPAGEHRIAMRFRPRYLGWGAAISLFTVIGYLGGVVARRRRAALTRAVLQ